MKVFLRKISSRKLWAAVVGVIVGIAAAFGIDADDYVQVVGVITSALSVVSYIFSEGQVDAARLEGKGNATDATGATAAGEK